MIEGVVVTPLRQIFDERGKVMHMMRNDSSVFSNFGEIYFSTTNHDAIKAWHLHKKMTLNYAVVSGQIKCVLYDDRENSPTRGNVDEYFLSPENYYLLTVPPMVWNGWKGLSLTESIVANCASLPHSSDEIERRLPNDKNIPYDWKIKHK
jgi:dTDP-4-dehydrorhamnose 3,5-epimerase